METLLATGLSIINYARASDEYFVLKKYPALAKKKVG
jgi:hypothetical protein